MTPNQDKHIEKDKRQLRVRKKERTKQTILTEAEKFFSEKSMNKVSLEDIAEAAFVSRTTLYNYFKNKDEIFFTLGTQTFKETNEFLEKNFPSDLPGHEQVLHLCEHGFRESIEKPLNNKFIREYFKRTSYVYHIYLPYLVEFYKELEKNRDLWLRAVRNGKKDKTIRLDLEDVQILQFLYMLMMGIADQMELRKSTLNRIRMDRETVIRNSLNLIAIFLKNESKTKK